ncbi:histone deacetylase [bacterium]|nr:histone deacetylase [bacterium]
MISALPVYYCVEFLDHDTGDHPENAGRLTSIINAIDKDLVIGVVELRDPRPASKGYILLNHDDSYYEMIKEEVAALSGGSGRNLDPDTIISPGSFIAAEKAVGAGIDMLHNYYGTTDENGKESRAIALPRPPGHHAIANRAMGFCLFNNIAIAARAAIRDYGLERVAILDWDVHHGNGTENSFYSEKEILYISTHQHPAYPGTGRSDEIGIGDGEGFNVNIPLAPVSGDAEAKYCFASVIMPVLEQYDPQILLISAGYDAHERDPLASLTFSTQTFRWMAGTVDKFCSERGIPMFAFLEGGYDYTALAASVIETMRAMRGEVDPDEPEYLHVMDNVKRAVKETQSALSNNWKFS